MSSDVIIVPRDIGRRAEGWIVGGGAGNVIKGVELLLEENLFHETSLPAPGPSHVDCSAVFKRAMKILSDSPFDALGVDLSCGTIDVRKAYKKLALKYHPDKNPKTTPLFQLVQTAMSKLSAAEDRQKEIEAQQRKKTSFPPATGAHPTPSSFSAKNTPSNASNNNPRPTGAAPNGAPGPGSYFHSASYDSYSGKHNAYSNPPNRSNNPFAQANAQRQQSYPSATPSASNAANNNNNEARRRNYYEELLKEQYRKAAESDQRAKEYAAKRAAEQKAEFDGFAKRAQQAYAQYQHNLHNFNAHNNTNSTNAGTNTQQPTPRGPADPPLNSFRAGYNNSSNPPSARGESGSAKTSYHPFANNSNAYGANNNSNNNAGSNAGTNPNSARSSSSSARDSVPPVYPGMSTGRTYGVRSDGRVFPQPQSYVSPRPTADNTSGKNVPPANNGSGSARERERQSVPPLRPSMASNSSDSNNSNKSSNNSSANNAANNNSAGNNKKVVPKPFSFRVNSVSSAVVELEWKTSLLHHCALGVELSWKEHSAGIWEVSEKLIRSGCCRKKNLLPTHCYDFRVRAVEDLPHGLTGSKSEWSEVLSVVIPAASATPQDNQTNQSNTSNAHKNHNNNNTNSNNTNSNRTSESSSKQSAPTNTNTASSSSNANASVNSSKSNEGESAKLQPSAPTSAKLSGAAVPQKFRRFNSKTHRQMDLDSQHGSYGDVPRDSTTKEKEKDETEKENNMFSSPNSSSKVFSASAREAWGKETLSAKHASDSKDKDKGKEKERSKERDGESDFGEDVQFVEVDGELDGEGDTTEIEEEEELRRKDRDKLRKRDKSRDEFYVEDEVTEDEEIATAQAAKKKNTSAEDTKKKSSPGHAHANANKSQRSSREPGAGVRIHPEQGDNNNRDGAESNSTLSSADRDRGKTLPRVEKDSRTTAAKKQHIFPHKIDDKKKETPKKALTPAALNKQASISRDSKEKKGGKDVYKKRSPFSLTEDEESSDAYEGEGFAIEEEMHFQLVSPAASINGSGTQTSGSGRKKGGEKSRSNVMEVLGHPVHCEPFARSEVAGFLLADQTVVANATCGDWARVKLHVTKDAVSSSSNASSAATLNGKKRVSTNSSTPDVQAQKAAVDVWGWCLIKDKTQTFLKPVESKRAPSVMRARRSSSSSSISSRTDSRESSTHTPVKSRETSHATNVNEFKTPLTRKTLGSKNSLGNTSLFNLNKPTPVTNKKPADTDLNNIGKLASDVESIDLEDEDSFDEEQDVEEWTECHDDQGHIYYYNQKTNQSSWDAPEWIEEVDVASGAKYYCHFVYNGEEVSMTSTWTRPKRFARVYREVPDV